MKLINGKGVTACWECDYCSAHPFKDDKHICIDGQTKGKEIPDAMQIAGFCMYADVESMQKGGTKA